MPDPKNDKPTETKPAEQKPSEPTKPLESEAELSLRAEIAHLKEQLKLADEKNAALESLLNEQEQARAAAKTKKADGATVAIAKIAILGEGRRVVAPGKMLRPSECDGLVEGVHYELGTLDG